MEAVPEQNQNQNIYVDGSALSLGASGNVPLQLVGPGGAQGGSNSWVGPVRLEQQNGSDQEPFQNQNQNLKEPQSKKQKTFTVQKETGSPVMLVVLMVLVVLMGSGGARL